jgi:hypothetical protein
MIQSVKLDKTQVDRRIRAIRKPQRLAFPFSPCAGKGSADLFPIHHSDESRNPEKPTNWTSAFAGMTNQSAFPCCRACTAPPRRFRPANGIVSIAPLAAFEPLLPQANLQRVFGSCFLLLDLHRVDRRFSNTWMQRIVSSIL